ncbi:resistance to inhibitors of cholinesterase protein 3 [Tetranychus urticae]|uniref:Resistance to inhibitors of cholinesterase protein 3 N-terminal domain-containing protein n=1 Tax=Tetranychus urticae TaxID=32264 RepID=T1L403_TETUR|nr:resistance to inhibitors of cholinesterase protein 3 [Tetranychus urticae]
MSKVNHLSNGKSIMILGTVVGCLSLLWPKVFYPMMQGGFHENNPDANMKAKIHPRMKATGTTANNHQPDFNGPNTRYHSNEQSSVSGASVGIIMTVYTVGIILLFIYTIFKYMSADNSIDMMEEYNQRQLVKNSDQDSKAKEKKGKASFNEYNHEQGECLKGLALNYVRCKQKLDPEEKKAPETEDDVSSAYRVLLGDMLELRDYLLELQCTGSCQDCDSQCADCEICQNEANEASKLSNSTSTLDIDENQGTHDENDDSFSEQLENVNDDLKESDDQSDRTIDESDSDGDICQTNEEDVEE